MKRLLIISAAIALAAAIGMTPSAKADNERGSGGFIGRDSRIAGCIAIVDDVRNNVITPTEWLEANKEEFRDLQIELKKRKYSQTKAKDMMMGMAISLCMERKGYSNKCIADSDNEDADLQVMQTAPIYSCWSKNKQKAEKQDDKEGASAPSTAPSQSQVVIINPAPPVIIQQPAPPPQPVIVEPPVVIQEPLPPVHRPDEQAIASMPLPRMSTADLAQYNEDVSIISQPVTIIGDDEGGRKEARLAICVDNWQAELHHRRPPEVRQILLAVRIWRCMFRTHYTIMPSRCPNTARAAVTGWGDGSRGTAISGTRNPYCYARFA